MKRIGILLALVLLSGCVPTVTAPPVETVAFPDKAAANVTFLTELAAYPSGFSEIRAWFFNERIAPSVTTGAEFSLVRETADGWVLVPFDEGIAFDEMAYLVEAWCGQMVALTADMLPESLGEGRYRLIKRFWVGEKAEECVTWAEFFVDDGADETLLSLTVKDGTLTKTGATFLLENRTQWQHDYGNPYRLERLTDGDWAPVPTVEDLAFTLPAYLFPPGACHELPRDWSYGYGELPHGTYRFVTDVGFWRATGDSDEYTLTAEFTL